MYLFEKAKAHAYVIQWAEAALFAVQTEDHEQVRIKPTRRVGGGNADDRPDQDAQAGSAVEALPGLRAIFKFPRGVRRPIPVSG